MTTGIGASRPAVIRRDHLALQQRFEEVDWAFDRSVSVPPHNIHPYPARFIPEIPDAGLRLIDDVDGDVLDPFCGAGTTLVEGIRFGRRAIGVDLNPIAALISRVKTRPWLAIDEAALRIHAEELGRAALAGDTVAHRAAIETIPRLDHWFARDSQELLAGATAYCRSISDPSWRDRVAVAISASVVRLSRQDSDTRYAAVDRSTSRAEGAQLLVAALLKTGDQLRAFSPDRSGGQAQVILGDARDIAQFVVPGTVAAAIFSPPYPNAYEYWLYHKYRMFWLGYDPIAVRTSEIGARPYYSGSGRATIETFGEQMLPVMAGIGGALVPGGICLVVVGDSLIRGQLSDTAALFTELARASGLMTVATKQRPIRQSRKSFNPAVSRAAHEHVLLFAKA